ncbi:MAG: PKD domain-containing protein [Flavobacteriaceae bacterium]|nr:PKD domain-containing protein [Flavobacteriaceae bacterium]
MTEQSKMSKHIDKNVLIFFLLLFLSSASLLAYKVYKNAPCKEVMFTIDSNKFMQGELIKFSDETEGAEVWNWRFGDSTEINTSRKPIHIFKKPGEYKITLLVNNICERTETIIIKEKVELLDPNKFPKFSLPDDIIVGETLEVSDKTPNASTWEWRFGETAKANSTKKSAEYIYKTSGFKTVSLIVNGDIKYLKKIIINVLPKEEKIVKIKSKPWSRPPPKRFIKDNPINMGEEKEEEKEKPKEIPFISENDFKEKLLLVSKGELKPNHFNEYLCGINKDIIVNKKLTTFLIFCEKIKNKKIKIKEFSILRDSGSNCIKTITINYRKTGFWFF